MNRHAPTFDSYYETSTDPWGYRTRWYEERKRAILLAALPQQHYDRAWEIGCSNGELSAALSKRCTTLLATDGNERAVSVAQARLADYPAITVQHAWHPEHWPEGKFDLILFSELGYYMDPPELRTTARLLATSLEDEGIIVACHWRHSIADCVFDGDGVHSILAGEHRLPRLVRHTEEDFVLEIWGPDYRSVARREGLT